jgi:hypothetical protein
MFSIVVNTRNQHISCVELLLLSKLVLIISGKKYRNIKSRGLDVGR